MIRKLATTTAAVAAVLTLAGCGGAQWTEAAQSQPAPTPPEHTPAEYNYLDRLDHGEVYYSSEQVAIDAGHAVCGYLDRGGSLFGAAAIGIKSGLSTRDAGYLAGAATILCPRHAPQGGGR